MRVVRRLVRAKDIFLKERVRGEIRNAKSRVRR